MHYRRAGLFLVKRAAATNDGIQELSLTSHADMLQDCATEQELYWMTEDDYNKEELAEVNEDPNAVIGVQELAHGR